MVEDHPDWEASRYLQENTIKEDKDLVTTKKNFTCKKCDSTFETSFQLRKHKDESGHKNTYLGQSMKRKMLENDPNLDPNQVFNQVNPQCPVCHKTFYKRQNLKIHMASVHEGKKEFKCNICNAVFKSNSGKIGHISAIHEGKKPHHCSICSNNFSKKSNLREHTVCLTELDTTFKINNSYSRPDIDPNLYFFEGCKY